MSKIVDKLTASTDTAGTTRDTIIATDGAGSDPVSYTHLTLPTTPYV